MKADHFMLLSTPAGRPVTYSILRSRWYDVSAAAAENAEAARHAAMAADLRRVYLRDMRKRAVDRAGTSEEASALLQHSCTAVTSKHYRKRTTKIVPVR